jgi:putative addiction module antidote
MKAKVQKIGNSLGVILPKDVLARMHIGLGDELNVSEGPGELKLRVYDWAWNSCESIATSLRRSHNERSDLD